MSKMPHVYSLVTLCLPNGPPAKFHRCAWNDAWWMARSRLSKLGPFLFRIPPMDYALKGQKQNKLPDEEALLLMPPPNTAVVARAYINWEGLRTEKRILSDTIRAGVTSPNG